MLESEVTELRKASSKVESLQQVKARLLVFGIIIVVSNQSEA